MAEKAVPGARSSRARSPSVRPATLPLPSSGPAAQVGASNDGLLGFDPAAALRSARAIQTLLASARHELRSPLQALLGFAELLESGSYGPLSAAQQAFLGHMRTAGQELTQTIEVCSQIASALATSSPASLDTCPLDTTLIAAFARAHAARGTRHELVEAPAPGLTVRASAVALERALTLSLDALAANTRECVRVEVRVERELVHVTLGADRSDASDDDLHEIDDALVEGPPSRGALLLKLAALTLQPFAGSVSCSQLVRRVHLGLTRT